jgi:hypothetical protein
MLYLCLMEDNLSFNNKSLLRLSSIRHRYSIITYSQRLVIKTKVVLLHRWSYHITGILFSPFGTFLNFFAFQSFDWAYLMKIIPEIRRVVYKYSGLCVCDLYYIFHWSLDPRHYSPRYRHRHYLCYICLFYAWWIWVCLAVESWFGILHIQAGHFLVPLQ